MTNLDLYDAALIEINKLEAPSMLLEDYNYLINKAVQQYINKKYNTFEINQQSTDDLNFLRKSVILDIKSIDSDKKAPGEDLYHSAQLPEDYLHVLNAIVTFNKNYTDKSECKDKNKESINVLCRRLTSDQFPSVLINAYLKPSYTRPYFFLHDIGSAQSEFEFRTGSIKKYKPFKVYIDYLKVPDRIEITEEVLDGDLTPNELEFPDYVAYEIINEFTKLLLENASDPRLETNNAINQTIGSMQSQ